MSSQSGAALRISEVVGDMGHVRGPRGFWEIGPFSGSAARVWALEVLWAP